MQGLRGERVFDCTPAGGFCLGAEIDSRRLQRAGLLAARDSLDLAALFSLMFCVPVQGAQGCFCLRPPFALSVCDDAECQHKGIPCFIVLETMFHSTTGNKAVTPRGLLVHSHATPHLVPPRVCAELPAL